MSETYLATLPSGFRRFTARGKGVLRNQPDAPVKVRLPRKVVIKLSAPARMDTNNRGISNEQAILPRLIHSHVVRILNVWHETGEERGYRARADLPGDPWFCVFEYLPGGSLADWLEHSPQGIPLRHALRVASELVAAVRYLHQKRIVHMDLKPANILFRRRSWLRRQPRQTVLIDFGVACHFRQASQIGTWNYMSPERRMAIQSQKLIRAQPDMDIFSLGIIFYEMLCGQNPIASRGSQELESNQEKVAHHTHKDANSKMYALAKQAMDDQPQNRPAAEEIILHP